VLDSTTQLPTVANRFPLIHKGQRRRLWSCQEIRVFRQAAAKEEDSGDPRVRRLVPSRLLIRQLGRRQPRAS
jgi:hypothetical protein